MGARFGGTDAEVAALERVVAEVTEVQRVLVENHPALAVPDRAAHQQQIGAGRVVLEVGAVLPVELDGVGLFEPGARAVGIGRISTGLGCPHLETDPDFLGLMLAFRTRSGERVDFLGINDRGAPTDTVEEFMALLAATAASAGAEVPFGGAGQLDLGNLTATQAKLFNALRKRLGVIRATGIFLHIARQTTRTARSSSAVQTYWTGVVEASGTPGKFAFVPATVVNEHRPLRPGARYLSEDWARRVAAGDIVFDVHWIPFVSEQKTPLEKTSEAWAEDHAVHVATATFPQADAASRDARLIALLASEMGANPGNWVCVRDGEPRAAFPATTFTAGRQLAYARSQDAREVLAASAYEEFFDSGIIGPDLVIELEKRHAAKVAARHAVTDAAAAG
jgi:hypothetical protein